ncbi:MAG: tetratricopeptide repeat protein [Desulfobacterales bacterium]|nr:tetratricopeptide repeat protein [Desulfobacterales bacterium]
MTQDDPFYTVTMARVHAQQGNLEEARRVYRHLLEKEPGRPDLVAALEALENRCGHSSMDALQPLFREWLALIFRYNQMQKLKKLSRPDKGNPHV